MVLPFKTTEPPVQKEVGPEGVMSASVTPTFEFTRLICEYATVSPLLFEKSELLVQVKFEAPKALKRSRQTVAELTKDIEEPTLYEIKILGLGEEEPSEKVIDH